MADGADGIDREQVVVGLAAPDANAGGGAAEPAPLAPPGDPRSALRHEVHEMGRLFCDWCGGRAPLHEIADGTAELIALNAAFSLEPFPVPMQHEVWDALVEAYADFDPAKEYLSVWGGTSVDPASTQAWLDAELERWRTTVAPRVQAWLLVAPPPQPR